MVAGFPKKWDHDDHPDLFGMVIFYLERVHPERESTLIGIFLAKTSTMKLIHTAKIKKWGNYYVYTTARIS
jgi:hypothetical protein